VSSESLGDQVETYDRKSGTVRRPCHNEATPDAKGNGDDQLRFNPNIGAKIQNNIGGNK
jgi:hypothetical protein